MTEAEWLPCQDPLQILGFLEGKVPERKLRLFAVACCRNIWHLLPGDESRHVVEVAEKYADGLANDEELNVADRELFLAPAVPSYPYNAAVTAYAYEAVEQTGRHSEAYYTQIRRVTGHSPPSHTPGWESAWGASEQTSAAVAAFATDTPEWHPRRSTERAHQCKLIRDIFGNPFRPITLDPAWLTPKVKTVAQAIYDDRAFDRVPELADALTAAGCTNQDILSHCRGPGPHVRGCWVVDLILSKDR